MSRGESEINVCTICVNEIDEEDVRIDSEGDCYCPDCYDNEYGSCEDCNTETKVEKLVLAYNSRRRKIYICPSCYERNYFECSSCNEIGHIDYMRTSEDGNCYCYECYEEIYSSCSDCGDEVLINDSYTYHDEIHCSTCYDDHVRNDDDEIEWGNSFRYYDCPINPTVFKEDLEEIIGLTDAFLSMERLTISDKVRVNKLRYKKGDYFLADIVDALEREGWCDADIFLFGLADRHNIQLRVGSVFIEDVRRFLEAKSLFWTVADHSNNHAIGISYNLRENYQPDIKQLMRYLISKSRERSYSCAV